MHEQSDYLTWMLFFVAGALAGGAERAARRGEELGGAAARRVEEARSS